MKKNNENIKRTYIPQTIGDTLKNLNQKISSKYNKNDFIIYTKWNQIVGPFFANHSEPIKISSTKIFSNDKESSDFSNCLYVNVSPSVALEFQHFKNKIIEKINGYFGYKAIANIKIFQNFSSNFEDKSNFKIKKQKDIKNLEDNLKKQTKNIKNKDLEESIVKLGISIIEEE